jgi:hypothetical protein
MGRRWYPCALAVSVRARDVADKILAHQPAKLLDVAGIYQRHDFARERAAALDAWAAHVTGNPPENVIQLQRAG